MILDFIKEMFACDCTRDLMKRASYHGDSYHGGSVFSFSSGIYYQIGSDSSGGTVLLFSLFFWFCFVLLFFLPAFLLTSHKHKT